MTSLFSEKSMPKIITLRHLRLTNFKGIRNLEMDFGQKGASIYGDNGTGKTTIMDAFMWVLFNKDSIGQTNFEIKTLNEGGNAIPQLDHEVELGLEVNGEPVILRKNYREKWTTKRGSAATEFTGHQTDYFIDDIPKKKIEFAEFIQSLIDESMFKLLTNPLYFNERLTWKDRRKILMDLMGDTARVDIPADADDEVKSLLQKHDSSEVLRMFASKIRDLREGIAETDTRLNEAQHMTYDVSETEEQLRDQALLIETEIGMLKHSPKAERRQADLNEVDRAINTALAQLNELVSEFAARLAEEKTPLEEKLSELMEESTLRECNIRNCTAEAERTQLSIEELLEELAALRTRYRGINDEFPLPSESELSTCYACGQTLPEAHRQQAIAAINVKRSEAKEEINAKGHRLKTQVEKLQRAAELAAQDIEQFASERDAFEAEIHRLHKDLNQLKKKAVEDDPRYKQLLAEVKKQEARRAELLSQNETTEENASADKIAERQAELQEIRAKQNALANREAQEERVKELAGQKKEMAVKLEETERRKAFIEAFIIDQVQAVEKGIEKHFELARFKMFEELLNGGMTETCETTYNGVPYDSGLNSAMKINVGLDIIRTLSDFYQIRVPVFIDNAESMTKLIRIPSQTVRLVVSGADKALRVEMEE